MADATAVILARMEARMEANMESMVAIGEVSQSLLRTNGELLKMILERLTPQESDGPSMGELLAELVVRVGNVDQRAKRILTRVDAIASDLPADLMRLINGEVVPEAAEDRRS